MKSLHPKKEAHVISITATRGLCGVPRNGKNLIHILVDFLIFWYKANWAGTAQF